MWEELASYRNHFLQLEVDNMKKETLNKFVTTEFHQKQKKRCKCVCPNDDKCESSTYFRDHAALAYGFICMEKLTEKMCSDAPLEKWQNINSLSEVLLNPWQAQRAITEYSVVRRCKNMFMRIQMGYHKEHYQETRQLMKIFYLISSYLNGAQKIVSHANLVSEFYAIIYNREPTHLTACKILRNLTEKTEVLLHLLDNTNAFRLLAQIFNADACTPFYPNPLWEHLCHFLEIAPKLGINYGYFELLVERIQSRRLYYHKLCMKCFAMLLRCEEGERRFDKIDGIKMLYDIIADETRKLDSYEFIMLALMHGLVSKFALWRCREFTDFPKRIIALAMCENQNLQLECLKQLLFKMWEELASYRNHFLQLEVDNMKKETLNKFVTTEFHQKQKKRCKCVCPNDDKCESSTYFRDHAALAYGFICMEKLTEKMCSDAPLEKWQNINSLSEVLLNPWQAQRAITEYSVVRRCKNMFMRIQMGYHKEHYQETRQLMKIFYLISSYLNGAQKIVSHANLVSEFYAIIYNREPTHLTACKILRNLTEKTEVLLHLLDNTNAFRLLAQIFNADACTPFYPNPLWEHLCHFLEIAPKLGINYGYFELLVERIQSRRLYYHKLCMKCFAMLLRCEEGERRFDKIDGIKMLYDIIADETRKLDSYEFIMLALMHGLVSKFALWRCREFTDFPKRIIALAMCENQNLQLECLKVLRLMSAMPCVKAYILNGCMSELMCIKCLNEQNECVRDSLAEWLNREICDSSEM